MDGKLSLIKGVVRSREQFKFWWAPTICLEWLSKFGQILHACRLR